MKLVLNRAKIDEQKLLRHPVDNEEYLFLDDNSLEPTYNYYASKLYNIQNDLSREGREPLSIETSNINSYMSILNQIIDYMNENEINYQINYTEGSERITINDKTR